MSGKRFLKEIGIDKKVYKKSKSRKVDMKIKKEKTTVIIF
jgi:hypothetical protein